MTIILPSVFREHIHCNVVHLVADRLASVKEANSAGGIVCGRSFHVVANATEGACGQRIDSEKQKRRHSVGTYRNCRATHLTGKRA
jgi:hypothetical protein